MDKTGARRNAEEKERQAQMTERRAVNREEETKPDKNGQALTEGLLGILRLVLCGMVGLYMILLVAVMPFYHTEGYAHIGTDKGKFLLKSMVSMGGACLPVLLLAGIVKSIVWLQKNGWEAWMQMDTAQIAAYFRKKFSITDYFAIGYGISVILSYLCSDYRQEVLWGAQYWYMGTIPQLSLVFLYFLISRTKAGQREMARLLLPVSAIVFLLGYLNRFGIYPIDMKSENVQFISTIGNINWYCGYLVSVFFGGFCIYCEGTKQKRVQKILLGIYVAIGFATLVTQGSSSGMVTLVVILLVMLRRYAADAEKMLSYGKGIWLLTVVCLFTFLLRRQGILQITYLEAATELLTNTFLPVVMTIAVSGICAVLCYFYKKGKYPHHFLCTASSFVCAGAIGMVGILIAAITINTLSGGKLSQILYQTVGINTEALLTFSPSWGSNRGATWMAGIRCFGEQDWLHRFTGVGPDGMAAFLYQAGSEELLTMVRDCFGSARLTNAHNEWLTILVNTGILGACSFAGMMLSAIKRFLDSGDKISGRKQLVAACGFCLLAYTINNLFSFQQAMNVSTMFVVLGIGENMLRRK